MAEPDVPKGHQRALTIGFGPARGWRVMAWIRGWNGEEFDRTVRWRIVSPDKRYTFVRFRSCGSRNLQDSVGEGVFTQIFTSARTDTIATSSQSRRFTVTSPPAVPEPLSTQLFLDAGNEDIQNTPMEDTWACNCDAHLKLHPKCRFAGNLNPKLVHLQDSVVVGRGESCDLVLDSRRTPQMVSRTHARICQQEGEFTVTDAGSVNGLFINSSRFDKCQKLCHGDVVTFGAPTQPPEFDYIFEMRPDTEMRKDVALSEAVALENAEAL